MKRALTIVLILCRLAAAKAHASAEATATVPQASPGGAAWSPRALGLAPEGSLGETAHEITVPYQFLPAPFMPLLPAAMPRLRPGTVPVVIQSETRGTIPVDRLTAVRVSTGRLPKVIRILGMVLFPVGTSTIAAMAIASGLSSFTSGLSSFTPSWKGLLSVGTTLVVPGITFLLIDRLNHSRRRSPAIITDGFRQENLTSRVPTPQKLSLAPLSLAGGMGVSVGLTF